MQWKLCYYRNYDLKYVTIYCNEITLSKKKQKKNQQDKKAKIIHRNYLMDELDLPTSILRNGRRIK